MRSRYTAFARGDLDYLRRSWHPDFVPDNLTIDEQLSWLGLEILNTSEADNTAEVEFEASFLSQGTVDALHERSRFVRQQGQWLYTEGNLLPGSFKAWKPGRNEPCPCGSGKKFKRCCG